MLNFARFLVILAGLGSLPSVACSTACSAVASGAQLEQAGQAVWGAILGASIVAGLGALYVGLKAPTLGKTQSVAWCLVFSVLNCVPLLQMNFFGVGSAGLLVFAAILMLVAPEDQYRGVVKVEIAE